MGRFAAGDAPDIDRLVEETVRAVGAEIEALAPPRLAGVVLGGGYARGEGGVKTLPGGGHALYNDLDFYVVTEEGASGADIAAIAAALRPVSEKWTARLGVDVDFCTPKTPWRIRHDQERLMIQELVHGYVDVAGRKGEELFAGVERRGSGDFPWTEAVRLLVNRGAGLLMAKERGESGFAVRNINKCVLGAGDARLIARHAYRWKAPERAEALGDALYSRAVEWKFRPSDKAVCGWEEAREAWLSAADEVSRAGKAGRSLYQAVRWVARRRTLGELATFGLDPVARVFRRMRRVVEARGPFDPGLARDWEVFN